MKHNILMKLLLIGCQFGATSITIASDKNDITQMDRGRYLIATSGCNDCHTPGYPERGGNIPSSDWLIGSTVGFQGPWGTTYPSNLRLVAQSMTPQQWLERVNSPMRPPMPWFSLRDMSETDKLAIYHFIRNLGAKGESAPSYSPPGATVQTPYIEFIPKNLPQQASAIQ